MDKNNFIMSYSIDKTFDSDQFLKLRLRVCHDGESPNKTYFTVDTMREANKSLEYIPLLAHVYIDESTGKPVIGSHDAHIEEDRLNDGESRVIYDEQPIGLIPSLADNNCTIEEFDGMNYTFVDAFIWRDYANYAEQLVEDAVDVKLSMEIDFMDDALSYDAANERYNIASYRYRGITLLNEKLGTGMKNALATTNFSANEDVKAKMIVLMEELQKCLCDYNTDSEQEGVEMDMDNEEIVETAVDEVVADEPAAEVEAVAEEVTEEVVEEVAEEHPVEEEPVVEEQEEAVFEDLICTFRISHDDTRYGLQSLLNAMCDDAHFYCIESVFDKYFYYCDYFSGNAFKQSYKIRKDVVSFDGDPEPVYREFVTQAERNELEKLRKDYAALVEFKEKVESAELKAQKDAIFAKSEYSILVDEDAFKTLVNDAEKFSVEEIESKVKSIFADYVIKVGTFSAKEDDKKPAKTIGFNFSVKDENAGPYGGLFSKK
jgi:chemotaxis protein histidine kinase CheA